MKKSWRNNVEFYLIGLLLLTVIAFSIAAALICQLSRPPMPARW